MKRIFMILPLLALLLAGCAAGAYAPAGRRPAMTRWTARC